MLSYKLRLKKKVSKELSVVERDGVGSQILHRC